MKVTRCCADRGEVMAVHEHSSSWQEIKTVSATAALYATFAGDG
jgi:hypothetical protein